MNNIYFLLAQIFSWMSLIVAIIVFLLMVTSWGKEEKAYKHVIYIILTSLFITLFIVLFSLGYKII